ncbi:MAG: Diguanylate cyclase, partial [Acidobacteriota bacterium]|jgi:hypothetical protein
LMP